MSTFVPITSIQQALEYLISSDTTSHLARLWSGEIGKHYHWTDELIEEISTQLTAALGSSLRRLFNEARYQHLAQEEFHKLLEDSNGSQWLDTLTYIKVTQIPLSDAVNLCVSLREVTLKLLKDAGLLGFTELYVFMLLFDWVLSEVYSVWGNENELGHVSNSIQTFDITSLRVIAESVRSPVELNPVLQAIVERVHESGLWPMCAIGIIDSEDKEISVPAHSGFAASYPSNIKFPAGGSATLETIHRRHPIAIADVYGNHGFSVLPEAAKAAGYRSILMIPIFVADMQAVMAFCTEEAHIYNEDEIVLANAISQQVMIALENAKKHQHEKQRGDELESLNRLIAEQNQLLQRAISTHTALTRLVLDEAGLERILEAVRELLGNPVAVEDTHFHLLAFTADWDYFDAHRRDSIAAGGTKQSLFDNPEIASMLDDLHHHRRALLVPVLTDAGIEKRRIVAPIIAGAEILGYVWVMEGVHPFNELHDLITTEQAALVIALEMMKQRAAYETELRLKADFLSDLFSEGTFKESDLLQRASYLGFNFNQKALLLVVDIANPIWEQANSLTVQAYHRRIMLKIQETVSHISHENLVANQLGRIVVMIPTTPNKDEQSKTATILAEHIQQELHTISSNMNILIGVGETFEHIPELRDSFRQAIRSLEAAKRLGWHNKTIQLSDLGLYGVLFREGDNNELTNFAKRSIAPLIDYDQQNGTDLIHTLDVYLSYQSKLAESARELYIHVNTLRQRLERIEQILDVNLKDSFILLNLQVALRVYELVGLNQPS